jgi:hypothetical protein
MGGNLSLSVYEEAMEAAMIDNAIWFFNHKAIRAERRLHQEMEQVFMAINDDNIKTSGTEEHWSMDSRATVHVPNDDEGMTDIVSSNQQVIIGDGTTLTPTKKGTIRLINKKKQVLILHEVLHVPTFKKKNIISMGSLTTNGKRLATTESTMILERNGATMHLPRLQNMYYFVGHRLLEEVNNNAAVTKAPNDGDGDNDDKTADKRKKPPSSIDINEAHDKMGHFGEAMLRKTYKDMGMKLSGTLKPCDGCLRAKAQRKAISKVSSSKATAPGGRLCIDIVGPTHRRLKAVSTGGTSSTRRRTKHGKFPALVLALCDKIKASGKTIKFIRCDNTGENTTKLQGGCAERNITVEFTAPNTPQMSERRFLTGRDRALAMLLAARLEVATRNKLWAEATNGASNIGNMGVTAKNDKSCDE